MDKKLNKENMQAFKEAVIRFSTMPVISTSDEEQKPRRRFFRFPIFEKEEKKELPLGPTEANRNTMCECFTKLTKEEIQQCYKELDKQLDILNSPLSLILPHDGINLKNEKGKFLFQFLKNDLVVQYQNKWNKSFVPTRGLAQEIPTDDFDRLIDNDPHAVMKLPAGAWVEKFLAQEYEARITSLESSKKALKKRIADYEDKSPEEKQVADLIVNIEKVKGAEILLEVEYEKVYISEDERKEILRVIRKQSPVAYLTS